MLILKQTAMIMAPLTEDSGLCRRLFPAARKWKFIHFFRRPPTIFWIFKCKFKVWKLLQISTLRILQVVWSSPPRYRTDQHPALHSSDMVYTRACFLVCIILTMQCIYEGNEDVGGCYLGMFLTVWYRCIRPINLLSVKVLLLAQGGWA